MTSLFSLDYSWKSEIQSSCKKPIDSFAHLLLVFFKYNICLRRFPNRTFGTRIAINYQLGITTKLVTVNTPNQYNMLLVNPEHAFSFRVNTVILSPKLVQTFKSKWVK